MVKLSQAPVDQLEDALVGVYDDVLGLDVAVHYAFAVAEVQGFEQLVEVEADVEIGHGGDKGPEVHVIKMVEYLS